MAKERMVTRKVISSKKYQVYSMEGTELTPIKVVEAKGKVSERELEKELKVKKVVLAPIEETKLTYGMTVDEFMKYAKLIKTETLDGTEDEKDKEESAATETK
jgi:hypothetical protein